MAPSTDNNSFYFPSYQSSKKYRYQNLPAFLLGIFLISLGLLAYATISLDHPFGLSTLSRALYVDEGFYTDAAQNYVKFNQWMFPLDSRHWPGAPFVALLQAMVFSLFGVSIEAARMTSVVLSLVSGLAIYAIARSSLTPLISMLVSITGLLTFSFLGHARAAIPDPVATSMALLALLVFIRVRSRSLAIPLSIFLAFLAFFSKMYFLSVLASIIFLWGVELLILPMINKEVFDRKAILIFLLTGFILASSYLVYFYIFRFEITIFQTINKNKMPSFDLFYQYLEFKQSLSVFARNTKTNVILMVAALCILIFIFTIFSRKRFKTVAAKMRDLGRAEYAMATWLAAGVLLIGMLHSHKAHYHFFAILPVIYLGTVSLKLIFPERYYTAAMSAVLIAHMLYQVPFYVKWEQRPQKTATYDASINMVGQILEQGKGKIIPVIGEYSAQLGLFNERIMSLDVKWVDHEILCERLNYWRPQYHVNVVWHRSSSRDERYVIRKCGIVKGIREKARYPVFDEWKDEIVLTRIFYK